MLLVPLYFASFRALKGATHVLASSFPNHTAQKRVTRVLAMVSVGFWLGVLSRRHLHAIGERKFTEEGRYWKESWNQRGLFDWEKRVVEREFAGCKSLWIPAAGGGREVLALRRLGMPATGFDADPTLVRFANDLLTREGMVPDIQQAPWDHCPETDDQYDGVIFGWSVYTLIRGRERRVQFLREVRERVLAGSPVLLSFYTRDEKSPYFHGVAKVGNALARVLNREPVELGDGLVPEFSHSFTREELERELRDAGFDLVSYDRVEFGHCVARAAAAYDRPLSDGDPG